MLKADGGIDYKTVALAVFIAGGAGFSGGNFARVDPFTAADALHMEKRIQLNIDRLELELKKNLPPPKTRERIGAMENHLRRKDDFKPPSYEW